MKISFAYICDAGYVLPTVVSLQSLISSKRSNSCYRIYILGRGLSEQDVKYFNGYTRSDVEIRVIACDKLDLTGLHQSEIGADCVATESALIKFYLPEILSEESKVLYLDGDTIIQKDLSELFNIDLDGYFLAAVRDSGSLYYRHSMVQRVEFYFNSGVMLLNLDKMRKHDLTSKLIEAKKRSEDHNLMDQNVLNLVFNGNCLPIEIKYNLLAVNLRRAQKKWKIEQLNKVYHTSYDSLEEIVDDAAIVHFSSKDKPWLNYRSPFAYLWFKNFIKIQKRTPLIVTLTSFPGRITSVSKTIHSLLDQSLKPSKIVLWLASSQFPNGLDDLPEDLKSLQGPIFEIRWYEDIGSYKKLFPSLKAFPHSILVTADDDINYPQKWLERLYLPYLLHKENNKVIWCHRAHIITITDQKIDPYVKWIQCCYSVEASIRVFCTTGAGVLFPPGCFTGSEIFDDKYKKLCPTNDDVWIYAMLILNGYQIKVVPYPINQISVIEGTQEEALWKVNVRTQNDVSMESLCIEYPEFKFMLLNSTLPVYSKNPSQKKSSKPKRTLVTRLFFLMPVVNALLPIGSKRRSVVKGILKEYL